MWDYSSLVIGAIDLRGRHMIIFGSPVVEPLSPETVGGVTTSGDRKRIRGVQAVAKDEVGVGLQQNLEAN